MKFLLISSLLCLLGCTGSSVLKASRVSIFDEYFIMGQKRYKIYVAALARFSSERGRYTVSGDTIYLLGNKTGRNYPLVGYAFPDTGAGVLIYKNMDSNFSKTFKIHYYRPGN